MTCTSPVLIKNPNPKFGDRYSYGLWVPCGHCTACRIAHAREWATRLMHESLTNKSSCFLTLTYNDENLPSNGSLVPDHLQKFFKRFRKALDDRKIKYYACGEYGGRYGRPHYHAAIFGFGSLGDLYYKRALRGYCSAVIDKAWPYGNHFIGALSYDSARYIAGYIGKKYNGEKAIEVYGDKEIPFQRQSKGIGELWALENAEYLNEKLGCTHDGVEVGLPRYYRKVLGIGTEQIAEQAKKRAAEVAEFYSRRGIEGEAELAVALKDARKQSAANIAAREALSERDKF